MKITDYILCEDIRQEADGKQSLMGVFGDIINVHVATSSKPEQQITFRLGIFIRIKFDNGESEREIDQVEITVTQADHHISLGKGAIKKPADGIVRRRATLSGIINNFPVKEDGNLQITVNIFNKDGEQIESVSAGPPVELKKVLIN